MLLAVIEDMVAEASENADRASQDLPDPVSRLRFSVLSVFRTLGADDRQTAGPRFITTEHWRLQRLYPGSIVKHALGTVLVPKPMTARVGGRPLRDRDVLGWAGDVIRSVVMDNVGQAARVATART